MEELISKNDFRIGALITFSKYGREGNSDRIKITKRYKYGRLIKPHDDYVSWVEWGDGRKYSYFNSELCYTDFPLENSIRRINEELNKLEQLIKIKSEK